MAASDAQRGYVRSMERARVRREMEIGESAEIRATERARISPRTTGYVMEPIRKGDGTSFTYTRNIYGTAYSFTAVAMPNGERRYFVSRYNGYGDDGTEWGRQSGMRFGCAWTPIHSLTALADSA